MTSFRNDAADSPAEPGASSAPYEPERGQWSHLEMLVGTLIDEVRILRWVTAAAAGGKPGATPEPLRRPGTQSRRRGLTDEQRRRLDPRLRVVKDDQTA